MNVTVKTCFLATLLVALAGLCYAGGPAQKGLKLSSTVFAANGRIPAPFTCDGGDTSPPLTIEGVPGGTRSMALVMDDPDAPAGLWVHWVLWNIDPATRRIEKGSTPPGAAIGSNSWGKKGYGGPCPPSGTHRYVFHLYALSDRLNLPDGSSRKDLDRAMRGKILARTELTGLYSRK